MAHHRLTGDPTASAVANQAAPVPAGAGDVGYYAVAASVIGTAHLNKGTERQDRLLMADVAGDLVICLADGLSTAVYGGLGAETAVREAFTLLSGCGHSGQASSPDDGTHPDRLPLRVLPAAHPAVPVDWSTALRSAITAARSAVLRRGGSPSDFNTTLTVVVVTADAIHVAQVGDGFVVVWDREASDRARVLAHEVVSAEDDPSLVVPLTAPNALASMLTESAPLTETSHVLVSSDGIAPLLLERWVPLVPSVKFLRALIRELDTGKMNHAGLADFLESTLVNSRTDDDKTVVLARHEPLGAAAWTATSPHPTPADVSCVADNEPFGTERATGLSGALLVPPNHLVTGVPQQPVPDESQNADNDAPEFGSHTSQPTPGGSANHGRGALGERAPHGKRLPQAEAPKESHLQTEPDEDVPAPMERQVGWHDMSGAAPGTAFESPSEVATVEVASALSRQLASASGSDTAPRPAAGVTEPSGSDPSIPQWPDEELSRSGQRPGDSDQPSEVVASEGWMPPPGFDGEMRPSGLGGRRRREEPDGKLRWLWKWLKWLTRGGR